MKEIRIGSGAGYGGDRIEPAIDLMRNGDLDYLIFECLAERTIALANLEKAKDPEKGYNHLFEYRFAKVLDEYQSGNRIKIVTNMGAANPIQAAKKLVEMATSRNIPVKVAAVVGDDVLDRLEKYKGEIIIETGKSLASIMTEVISANAYIGARGIQEALASGAEVVITGRAADPSLTVGILLHEFGWKMDDCDLLGQGTIAGHLLECAGQVTGGYYADGAAKQVPDLWNLGFPIAIIKEDGSLEITKTQTTGGLVNEMTCQEQTIYEIQDPKNYYTPDCIADFSQITIEQTGVDRVAVGNVSSKPSNGKYKVSVGYHDCFIGEGQISYGGYNAYQRAVMAQEILERRFELTGMELSEVRFDLIGCNSLFGATLPCPSDYSEIRLRVAGRTSDKATAIRVAQEVESLYTNGPYGGGGVTMNVQEVVSIASILIDQSDIEIEVEYFKSEVEDVTA